MSSFLIFRLRTETGIAEAINLAQSTLFAAQRNSSRVIVVITGRNENIEMIVQMVCLTFLLPVPRQ